MKKTLQNSKVSSNRFEPYPKLWLSLLFMGLLFSNQIRAQQDTVSSYPSESYNWSMRGLFVEITTNSYIEINKLFLGLDASNFTSRIDVYYREGGVLDSIGIPPSIQDSGWVYFGETTVTSVASAVPVASDGDLRLFLKPGKYGFCFYGKDEEITAFPFGGGWYTPTATVFSDGVVTLDVSQGIGFGTNDLLNNVPIDRGLVGGIIYSPVSHVPGNASVLSIDPLVSRCVGSQPVSCNLRNYGSTRLTSVNVNWSVNSVLQTPVSYTQTIDTIGGSGSFEASVSLGSVNMVAGQKQDIKVWTSMPNGSVDPDPSNDTSQAEVFTALSSGTYTIDPNGSGTTNFTSFKQVSDTLNRVGICGTVVFNVAPGVYTDHLYLGEIEGSSAINTISFNGGDTALVKLTYSSANDTPTVYLNGTDWVTFEHITIENTSNGDGWGVLLQNAADHITIDSCRIVLPISGTSDMVGIVASSDLSSESDGNNANFLTVSNNTFIGGEAGVTLFGNGDEPYCEGNIVRGNIFRFQDDHGIEMYYQTGSEIIDNDIDSLMNSGGDAMLVYYSDYFNVSNNRIVSPDWGFRILSGNDNYSGGTRSLISNNMVLSYTDRALIFDIENTDVYHNTAKGSYGMLLQHHLNLNMRNNIFYGFSSAAVDYRDLLTSNDTDDYNIYYGESGALIRYENTTFTSFYDWRQQVKGHADSSFQGNPFFVGPDDLHLTGWFAHGRADATVGISVDIDGDSRLPNSDIGADQYTPDSISCLSVTGYIMSNLGATGVDLTFDDAIGDSIQIEWGPCGFTQGNGGIIFGTSPLSINTLVAETCYEFYARRICDTTSSSFTAWVGPFRFETACSGPLSGTYTINATLPGNTINFQSFGTAIDRLKSCGIAGPVVFNVASGTYAEDVVIPEIQGSSSANTITFNGQDTSNTILSGQQGDVVLEIRGCDWLTISNLQLVHNGGNGSTLDANTLTISKQSKHITINSCKLSMPTSGINGQPAIILAEDDVLGWGSHLVVSNSLLLGGEYGVRIDGRPTELDSSVVITNNVIRNVRRFGLNIDRLVDLTVSGNLVDGTGDNYPTTSAWSRKAGAWIGRVQNLEISNNRFEVYSYGISLYECNTLFTPITRSLVTNNVVVSTGDGYPALTLNASANVNIYHNTFSSIDTMAAVFEGGSMDMEIKNNIFYSDSDLVVRTIGGMAGSIILDHNNYYSPNSADKFDINGTIYQSLSAWQTADVSRNQHSMDGDPMFVSTTDLYPQGKAVNNSGDPVGVALDFDGNTRSTAFPDMGAYEFSLPCVASNSGIASNIGLTTADLSWTAGTAHIFNIEYGPSGFALGSGTKAKAVNNPHSLSGLTPATTYTFFVQDSCGTEGASGWAGPFTFTTLTPAPCNISTSLGVSNITTGSADLYWTPANGVYWEVEYGPTGFTPGSGTVLASTNDTLHVDEFAGGICYDFYVQDSCTNGVLSALAGPFNFCMAACPNVGTDSTHTVCETSTAGININNLIGPHATTGTWTDLSASGGLSGNLFFPSTAGSGTHLISYKIDTVGCTPDSSVITFVVEAQANAGTSATDTLCDTLGIIDLSSYLGTHDAGGTWQDVYFNGALSGSMLDLSIPVTGKAYSYRYSVVGVTCPVDQATVSIYIEDCTIGLTELPLSKLRVYPNPSSTVLNLSFTAKAAQAKVYITDLSGQLVYSKALNNLNGAYTGSIDVSRLAAGTYLLTVESEGAQEVVRILRSAVE